MSLETMTKLATTTVGAGGSSSITFSNIPQGYTDLKILISARNNAGTDSYNDIFLSFNDAPTGSLYSYKSVYSIGTSTGSLGSSATSSIGAGASTSNGNTANVFGNTEINISNYSKNGYKSMTSDSVTEANTATNGRVYLNLSSGMLSVPSPITSLVITSSSTSFMQHTMATLYGVKNTLQTAGNSIKATGGNIIFDGTYVYHVFNSTGAFTPTQPILADALVVAGGGGAQGGGSAGAGAGGLVGLASQSLIATSYVVTVGAGGASGNGLDATPIASSGSNSQFGSLTAAIGGGYAPRRLNGISGGSGSGGPASSLVYSAGSGTPGQGNNGGAAYGNYSAGGGGGAGAVGATATQTQAGAGGIGSSTYSSWGLATGTGHNVSGTVYYAGGGGAAGQNAYSPNSSYGAGGSGGGGNGSTVNGGAAGNGLSNTGGGAGSGWSGTTDTNGGSGGSGIVIVRYKG